MHPMTITTHPSYTCPEAPATPEPAAVRAYLREVRRDRGLSIDSLAECVGTPPVTLAGALWGELPLSAEAAGRLATVLHIEPALVACMAEPEDTPVRLLLVGEASSDRGGQGRPAVVAKEGSD
jgi:cyanate lyase